VSLLLELSAVQKDYQGLRPLRIRELQVGAGEHVAVVGIDRPAAETLVNLITGVILPDAGSINVFGRSTAAIADADDWLATVDRFGIVSERAVLLDQLSVLQNLVLPFSLEIDNPLPDVLDRAAALGEVVGLSASLEHPVHHLDGEGRFRLRLGRALALDPAVVLFEHPTADVDRSRVATLASDLRRVVAEGGRAALSLTADQTFAEASATRVLALDAASGRLTAGTRGWFRRR
jgi:predicted ABC-type transport system involved in lysophospholipase L1 biosynthesis ATPase subunit